MMSKSINDQIETPFRTNLLLAKWFCQASTNPTNCKSLVQLDSMLVQRRTGVMSPEVELAQPRSQAGTWFLGSPTLELDHGR